jgi:hypothetical protein
VEGNKPTFKQLLDRHGITLGEFYTACPMVPGEDLSALCDNNLARQASLGIIIDTLNQMTQREYTPEDIYIRYIYGRTDNED